MFMNTSIKLSLDTRRMTQNGCFPIILRLTHFRKTTSIKTGHYVPEEYWDHHRCKVKRNFPDVDSVHLMNTLLLKKQVKAQEVINKLADNDQLDRLTAKDIADKIVNRKRLNSFYEFGLKKAEELKKEKRIGTSRNYSGIIGRLKGFTSNRDLKFNELNLEFLKRFERHHLSKPGNSVNGIASYMRTIKAIYNKGIKEGMVDESLYPFKYYTIKTKPTEKRAIKIESIKKILEMKTEIGSKHFHYRNYFVLSYLMLGMSFIDMAFLRRDNIIDGRVKFQRRKTGKRYDIVITKQIKPIIEYYMDNPNPSGFLLPIIYRDTLELQYKDAQWELRRYNIGLKEIAKKCGIEERLTSYVSRHSFATHAMFKKVPLEAISAMMGHNKLSTTQIYLKSLPSNILDTYQAELNSI